MTNTREECNLNKNVNFIVSRFSSNGLKVFILMQQLGDIISCILLLISFSFKNYPTVINSLAYSCILFVYEDFRSLKQKADCGCMYTIALILVILQLEKKYHLT